MLHLLRQFVVLAETGNYTRASERLNISQPALSKNIRRLESDFGCPLVERHSSGCILTVYGEILYHRAKIIGDEMQLLRSELAQTLQNQEKHLNVAWGVLWHILFASDILLEVERESQDSVIITGQSGCTEKMMEELLRGGCDIFLGRIPEKKDGRVVYEPLLQSHHLIFGHSSHPLFGLEQAGKALTIRELSRFKWIIFGSKSDLPGYEIPSILREKLNIQTIQDVNGFIVVVQILQRSSALILLPYQVAPVLKRYDIHPLEACELQFNEFTSGIMYRRDMADSPYLQMVVRAARKIAKGDRLLRPAAARLEEGKALPRIRRQSSRPHR